jgi:hypothetical protein
MTKQDLPREQECSQLPDCAASLKLVANLIASPARPKYQGFDEKAERPECGIHL